MPKQRFVRLLMSFVFFALNVGVVAFTVAKSNVELGLRVDTILGLSFLAYYIFGIYDFNNYRFKLNFIFISFLINFIGYFISYFSKVHNSEQFLDIFLFSFIFHISYKFIIAKTVFRKKNIIIVGVNEKIDFVKNIIKKHQNTYNYKGLVLFDKSDKKGGVDDVIGVVDDIRSIVKEYGVNEIVNLTNKKIRSSKFERLLQMKLWGVRFYNSVSFCEDATGKIPIDYIQERELLGDSGFRIVNNENMKNFKRILDIFLAIVIGVISLPIVLLSAIIVKLESKGPAFFVQERVGLGGEEFKIIKLRTMKKDAEKEGPKWARKKDSRVTFFGKILRKTRIDELPQLLNIIKNDMSFIGPRPEREFFINKLEEKIPYYNLRHIVKPGITGWAQVNYPYGASIEDAKRKLEYDLYYIKHQSLILEIRVVLNTLKIVLFGRGQ